MSRCAFAGEPSETCDNSSGGISSFPFADMSLSECVTGGTSGVRQEPHFCTKEAPDSKQTWADRSKYHEYRYQLYQYQIDTSVIDISKKVSLLHLLQIIPVHSVCVSQSSSLCSCSRRAPDIDICLKIAVFTIPAVILYQDEPTRTDNKPADD